MGWAAFGVNAPRSPLLTGVRSSVEETPRRLTLLGDHSLEPISTGILDLLDQPPRRMLVHGDSLIAKSQRMLYCSTLLNLPVLSSAVSASMVLASSIILPLKRLQSLYSHHRYQA